MSSGCKGCNGALYGCPWEDEDISSCDDKAVIERMTKLAYECGKKDAINEIEKHRFGKRGGLVHWTDISQMMEEEKWQTENQSHMN